METKEKKHLNKDELIEKFLNEKCILGSTCEIGATKFYEAFVSFSKETSLYLLSQQGFGSLMKRKFKSTKKRGKYFYSGVALLSINELIELKSYLLKKLKYNNEELESLKEKNQNIIIMFTERQNFCKGRIKDLEKFIKEEEGGNLLLKQQREEESLQIQLLLKQSHERDIKTNRLRGEIELLNKKLKESVSIDLLKILLERGILRTIIEGKEVEE